MARTLSAFTNMNTQRNLNISFRERDLHLLGELRNRSNRDYVSTSGITIDLIKKGIKYEEQQKKSREKITTSRAEKI
jgi:hypothetical protein